MRIITIVAMLLALMACETTPLQQRGAVVTLVPVEATFTSSEMTPDAAAMQRFFSQFPLQQRNVTVEVSARGAEQRSWFNQQYLSFCDETCAKPLFKRAVGDFSVTVIEYHLLTEECQARAKQNRVKGCFVDTARAGQVRYPQHMIAEE
ncbi:hypothetical protein [Aliagarivorans taiwanensis]|uniref:hypothetical protein n=1 Tax=Aliagarivorans taiwanensis TaxID=561966 RepID=UPI000427B1F4|nr:hypothetical protein [Aliagarivorans taiwanensis]